MNDAKRRLDDQKFGVVSESDRTAASKSAGPSPVRSSLCVATDAPTRLTCRSLRSSLVQDEPDFLDLDAPSSASAPTTTNNGSPQLSNAYPSPPPSPPLDPSSSETAAMSKELEDGNIPTKEVPYSVDPEKANIAQETTSAGIPFPSADDGDIPVDSALDAQVEAEVLRSYSVRFSRASLTTALNKTDHPRSCFRAYRRLRNRLLIQARRPALEVTRRVQHILPRACDSLPNNSFVAPLTTPFIIFEN